MQLRVATGRYGSPMIDPRRVRVRVRVAKNLPDPLEGRVQVPNLGPVSGSFRGLINIIEIASLLT